ncbi:hypothetical protein R3W88_016341 [Solanum pinnatisectum]|uniref:MADS-box domain-containing protein n=1 Tax=Solanum pinnatisectum TaxID=50273 RepID=A0AAV9KYH9_9SOLN|nr:hypothetical protein R3W88_016341 [Solanum pinnatisectum]
MTRKKVIFYFIENETDRKVSYNKRHEGLLKKVQELNTLCDIEMALIIYSPYITNEMHEVLNGKTISIDMNPYYLNDLSYVIKNLQLVHEAMKKNVGDKGSTSNVPQSTPSKTMTSMMPSPIIDSPFTPMKPQMDPSAEIPSIGASIQMSNYQNYSIGIPQSPSLIELLNWNDDDVVTWLDDLSLNNINDQDSNPTNNI